MLARITSEDQMSGWKKAVIFLTGSLVGGLALAFLAVAGLYVWRPEILAGLTRTGTPQTVELPDASEPMGPLPTTDNESAPALVAPQVAREAGSASYANAVRIAAPAVVNLYVTRMATERVLRSFLDDPFGEFAPRYRRRTEQTLGSGSSLMPRVKSSPTIMSSTMRPPFACSSPMAAPPRHRS